jgi:diguanylate cyclase (GGDEF)-like protein
MSTRQSTHEPSGRRTAARSVVPLTAALFAIGALTAVATWSRSPISDDVTIPVPVLAAIFLVAEVCVLHIYVRRHAHTFSLSEIPMVLGLVFVSPAALFVARLAGSAVALVGFRRQSRTKIAFNLAYFTVDCGVSILIYRLILGNHSPLDSYGWFAALAATTLSMIIGTVTIAFAIAVVEGAPIRLRPGATEGLGLITTLISTDLGLVAVAALRSGSTAAVPLAVAAVTLFIGYRSHARLRQSNQGLAHLYSSSRTLSSSLAAGTVADDITEQACELLRAQVGELILDGRDGRPAVRIVRRDGVVEVDDRDAAAALRDRLACAGNDGATLHRDAERLADLVGTEGWTSAIVAVLNLGDGVHGALSVANPRTDVDQYGEPERQLLETFANQAGIALRNQRLVEDLRREAVDRQHQALHDSLTGLPNRTLLHQHLHNALRVRPDDGGLSVMFIDLDGFKEVNDTLGHHYGDALLQQVADRIVVVAGPDAFVARLGGDEFSVIVRDTSQATIADLARRIGERLLDPFELAGLVFEVGASIGVALCPEHGEDAPTLLQRADVAMYAAKRSGEPLEFYSPEADGYTPARLALAAELRRAIERRELLVEYQPKVAFRTGDVVGVEALARWYHPDHGFVPPETFVAMAEHANLVRALTEHVLQISLRQVAEWRSMGFELSLSVNLSARDLLGEGLCDMVSGALLKAGVPPSALTLEITESTLIVDPGRSVRVLNRLSSMGVSISIDDFGTGYSSLSYLHRLPVDEIKIDKSFITALADDKSDAVIVRSTIELAHNLGLQVTAEGLEDARTWALIASFGCDHAQGYHLRPPGSAGQITKWLRVRQAEQEGLRTLLTESSIVEPT